MSLTDRWRAWRADRIRRSLPGLFATYRTRQDMRRGIDPERWPVAYEEARRHEGYALNKLNAAQRRLEALEAGR